MQPEPAEVSREWPVWSTTARIVVTDASALERASAILVGVLDEIEQACSRFTGTSELAVLRPQLAAGAEVSPLLAELVRVALDAARRTQGAVDPTLGDALARLGYDRDFPQLKNSRTVTESRSLTGGRASGAGRASGDTTGYADAPVITLSTSIPGWRRVALRRETSSSGRVVDMLIVPDDLTLDLGATAKAYAADHAAALIAHTLGTGVLVSLGGDIATAGSAPDSGWQVTVEDVPGDPFCQVTLVAGQALATSSTQKRRWRRRGELLHHILDPSNGLPADPVWRTVTVAASSCVEANTFSTASVVLGQAAIAWLARRDVTARLVDSAGRVLTLGGWPDENSVHVRAAG